MESDLRGEYRALVTSRPELFENPRGAGFEILLHEDEIRQAEEHVAEQLRAFGAPPEWAAVGIAYKDQYGLILRDAVRYSNGSLGTYIRLVAPPVPGVVILPVWQGKILLIRHFRHATRSWHLEIPRGMAFDANVENDANRELTEEIGASGTRLVGLGDVYPDTGLSNSRVALFYAEVASYGEPETNEAITHILPTPAAEFEQKIADGEITDGFVLAAYARAKARNLLLDRPAQALTTSHASAMILSSDDR
jgi:ADP-ribose pyrophosphatase